MRRSLAHSLALHAAVLLIVILGLPHFGEDEIMKMNPVAVELVTISDISSTPPKGDPNVEPPKEAPKPEPPKPEPPQPPEPVPEPPKPEVVPEPQPEPVPEDPIPTPDAPKLPPPKPPKPKPPAPKQVVQPKPPEKKQPEKKPVKNAFNNLLSDLTEDKPEKKKPSQQKGIAEAPADAPNISSALNMSEMDAVRNQVMGCWLEPTGLKEGQKLVVEIRVTINRDRTVQRAEVVDKARMRSDPFYRTLGESAVRALYNPRCSPLLLPADKYNTWRITTFRFSPGEIF